MEAYRAELVIPAIHEIVDARGTTPFQAAHRRCTEQEEQPTCAA